MALWCMDRCGDVQADGKCPAACPGAVKNLKLAMAFHLAGGKGIVNIQSQGEEGKTVAKKGKEYATPKAWHKASQKIATPEARRRLENGAMFLDELKPASKKVQKAAWAIVKESRIVKRVEDENATCAACADAAECEAKVPELELQEKAAQELKQTLESRKTMKGQNAAYFDGKEAVLRWLLKELGEK